MNRIEDEQVKFFLGHETRIREWAALEVQVSKFVHRFYRSLKGDLDAALRSGRIAEDSVMSFRVGGKWPGLGLRREGWPTGKDDPNVRLEWFRKSALFPPHGWLICGVRTNVESYRSPFTKEARPAFPRSSRWWPAYSEPGSSERQVLGGRQPQGIPQLHSGDHSHNMEGSGPACG